MALLLCEDERDLSAAIAKILEISVLPYVEETGRL